MATVFTKIINGEIPSWKIAENELFYSFLDIRPISKGHTLVVPKQETDYIFDLDDGLLGDMMVFSKSIAHAIDRALSPIRTGIVVEGLEVPHAHIHLVPIYDKKQQVALGNNITVPDEQMKELSDRIRKEWESAS
ncbi:HIT family protein [Natronogracilivirga saccharolytica]|uniref:HIT family protein n=1 Tax=Natronogracilivirga saccharolytica TaxID=2812953 RepID=A0A8J7SCE2_9BACT|nr:HIT family protein [Natronogracilivirga saccharolytica]MBP3193451.1 HIT family protein [Natronogracilivirga saccharolytica]